MALSLEEIRRLSQDELVAKLCEEGAEVIIEIAKIIHAAAKLGKFGPRPLYKGKQYNNVEDIIKAWSASRRETNELSNLVGEVLNRDEAAHGKRR